MRIGDDMVKQVVHIVGRSRTGGEVCYLQFPNCCCCRENGSSDCPTCKHALNESQLFPDNYANREIQSLTVKCPNVKLGCATLVELRNVQVRPAHGQTQFAVENRTLVIQCS